MALKLPDASSLGGLPDARSGRPIASYDTSGIGQGIASFGTSLDNASADLTNVALRDKSQGASLDEARASADALTAEGDLRQTLGKETDPNGLVDKYTSQAQQAADAAAANIPDPYRRALFQQQSRARVAALADDAKNKAFDLNRGNAIAGDMTRLDAIRQAGIQSGDPAYKASVVNTANGLIDGWVAHGYYSPIEGQDLKKKWVQDYAEGTYLALPPTQRAAVGHEAMGAWGVNAATPSVAPGPLPIGGSLAGKTMGDIPSSGGSPGSRDFGGARGNGKFHTAVDIPGKVGDPILAENIGGQPGIVRRADDSDPHGYGNMVDVQYADGTVHRFAHLNSIDVKVGDKVTPGQVLGTLGHTGDATADFPHVHTEIIKQPAYDAAKGYLPGRASTLAELNASRIDPRAYYTGKATGPQSAPPTGASQATSTPSPAALSPAAQLAGFIPADRLAALTRDADSQARSQDVQAASDAAKVEAATVNDLHNRIIDGTAGIADIEAAHQSGQITSADSRQTLINAVDERDKGLKYGQAFSQAIATPGFAWNPYDAEQKKMVDAGFRNLGGDTQAVQTVAEKTGMVPQSAATVLRGAIVSGDPGKVTGALTVASDLMARNPAIFSGIDGQSDIENAATAFTHYVDHMGFSAAQAAQKVIATQSPEYQQKAAAAVKAVDIDQVMKGLSVNDIRSAFNTSFAGLATNPQLGATPEAENAMFQDYQDAFKEAFLSGPGVGDVGAAKAQAIAQMKRIWGVTTINGSGIVTRFPPEGAVAYRDIPGVSDKIAARAIASIKTETGEDVTRDKIVFAPLEKGRTSRPYLIGEPVPYTLGWWGKNGFQIAHLPFIPDADAMRAQVTEERQKAFDAARNPPPTPPQTVAPGESSPSPTGGLTLPTIQRDQSGNAIGASEPPPPAPRPARATPTPGPAQPRASRPAPTLPANGPLTLPRVISPNGTFRPSPGPRIVK